MNIKPDTEPKCLRCGSEKGEQSSCNVYGTAYQEHLYDTPRPQEPYLTGAMKCRAEHYKKDTPMEQGMEDWERKLILLWGDGKCDEKEIEDIVAFVRQEIAAAERTLVERIREKLPKQVEMYGAEELEGYMDGWNQCLQEVDDFLEQLTLPKRKESEDGSSIT